MSNELKDIAERLSGYSDDGWSIFSAEKQPDGSWSLVIKAIKDEAKKEASDDNN